MFEPSGNQLWRQQMIVKMILGAAAAAAISSVAGAQSAPSASAGPVAVVVNIQLPPGFTREKAVAAMQKTVPQYQALPGLARKYFTLSDDGKFGGIYLWKSRAEAQAWFSDAWRAKATATYGAAPEVAYFDAPIVIVGPATVVTQ
jgi:hypothetical protein